MKTATPVSKLPKTLRLELDGLKDLFHSLRHELVTIGIDDELDLPTRQKLLEADRVTQRLYRKLFGDQEEDHAILYTRKKTRRRTVLEIQLYSGPRPS